MRILIHPFSAKLRSGNCNPKNFPWWPELVQLLEVEGHTVNQIGVDGEDVIPGVGCVYFNRSLKEIVTLVNEHDLFIAVDSFLPHLAHVECSQKPGIVLWSQSDPNIFGHDEHVHILKSRQYLRETQYHWWEDSPYIEEAFVLARQVADAVEFQRLKQETALAYAYTARFRPHH